LRCCCFFVSAAIGIWLYRRYRHGKTLGEEVDEALDEQSRLERPLLALLAAGPYSRSRRSGCGRSGRWTKRAMPASPGKCGCAAISWFPTSTASPTAQTAAAVLADPARLGPVRRQRLVAAPGGAVVRVRLGAHAAAPRAAPVAPARCAGETARTLSVWVLFGTLLFAGFVTLTMFDLLLMLCADGRDDRRADPGRRPARRRIDLARRRHRPGGFSRRDR